MLRKRFFVNGEPVAGSTLHAEYLKPANTLLNAVKQRMQMGGLQQLAQRYVTEDGAVLTAMSRFGQDEIRIDVPHLNPASPPEQPLPPIERNTEFVEYCVWGADAEWLSERVAVTVYPEILMDRSGTHVYSSRIVFLSGSLGDASILRFDSRLRLQGDTRVSAVSDGGYDKAQLVYDSTNDIFALGLSTMSSGQKTHLKWLAGQGYSTHQDRVAVIEEGANSHGGGVYFLEIGTDAVLVDSLTESSIASSTLGALTGSAYSERGDVLGSILLPSNVQTETQVIRDVSDIGWAGAIIMDRVPAVIRVALNNRASRLFYLADDNALTIRTATRQSQIGLAEYGTPYEVLHDPITDAIAVCFSNVGALIVNARDCMENEMAPFFHRFDTVPQAFFPGGAQTRTIWSQFMNGSLLGYSYAGSLGNDTLATYCKIDIGRLKQTKITEQQA